MPAADAAACQPQQQHCRHHGCKLQAPKHFMAITPVQKGLPLVHMCPNTCMHNGFSVTRRRCQYLRRQAASPELRPCMLGMRSGHLGCMAACNSPWCFARLPFSFCIAFTGCITLHGKCILQWWRMQLHCRALLQPRDLKFTKGITCCAVHVLPEGMAACVPVSRLPSRPLCRAVLLVMLLVAGCAAFAVVVCCRDSCC